MSNHDKNYSYAEMLDAYHAGRSSMLNLQPEKGTGALEWIDSYTQAREKDEETKRIDTIVEAEQDDLQTNQEEHD